MTPRFAEKCQQQLGACVEYMPTRSPCGGGRGEKIHHLRAQGLRILLRHITGDVSLPGRDLRMLLIDCTSMLNGRPVIQFCYGSDEDPIAVIPDQLAYEYDRVPDPALCHLSPA